MTAIQIGYLLRGSTTGFIAGCRVTQFESEAPALGALVRVPLGERSQAYGLIYDIHIDDDGLVRQLVTAEELDPATIADNRQNRTVPVEISVLTVGYRQGTQILHLLPPRPPLSLDEIHLCEPDELCRFTSAGRFGYFRQILNAPNLPTGQILAAHIQQAAAAQQAAGNREWVEAAAQELITLLRDDHNRLMDVLGALSDTILDFRL
jgi:hypothetical protein